MNREPFPGFVDLQVNGFLGTDFSSPDLSAKGFLSCCRKLFAHGTCAFLHTLISSSLSVYRRNLPLIARLMEDPELDGRALGFHLEGPFLSPIPGASGIHDPHLIKKPDIPLLAHLIELACGRVRLITIAADQQGAEELTRYAVVRGITVSLGHHLPFSLVKTIFLAKGSGKVVFIIEANTIPSDNLIRWNPDTGIFISDCEKENSH